MSFSKRELLPTVPQYPHWSCSTKYWHELWFTTLGNSDRNKICHNITVPLHHIIPRWDPVILQKLHDQKHTAYSGYDGAVSVGSKHPGNTQSQPLSLLGVCQVPLADTPSHQWSLHQLEVGVMCCCTLDCAFSQQTSYLFLFSLFPN